MARSIKDIFCRYKTLKGFQVKRKAGWDTHGLPVELGVEKELGITKEDIGTKISVDDYNKACKEAVMRYTDIWNDLTTKMGYWVDMDDPYITYEPKYMESVWWLLGQMYEKKGEMAKAVKSYMMAYQREEIGDLTKDMMIERADELKNGKNELVEE